MYRQNTSHVKAQIHRFPGSGQLRFEPNSGLVHTWVMPKRISKKSRPKEINQLAHRLVEMSMFEPLSEINAEPSASVLTSLVMAEMGRKGGLIGGKRRLETMTSAQRIRVAKKAAATRWAKQRAKE